MPNQVDVISVLFYYKKSLLARHAFALFERTTSLFYLCVLVRWLACVYMCVCMCVFLFCVCMCVCAEITYPTTMPPNMTTSKGAGPTERRA